MPFVVNVVYHLFRMFALCFQMLLVRAKGVLVETFSGKQRGGVGSGSSAIAAPVRLLPAASYQEQGGHGQQQYHIPQQPHQQHAAVLAGAMGTSTIALTSSTLLAVCADIQRDVGVLTRADAARRAHRQQQQQQQQRGTSPITAPSTAASPGGGFGGGGSRSVLIAASPSRPPPQFSELPDPRWFAPEKMKTEVIGGRQGRTDVLRNCPFYIYIRK